MRDGICYTRTKNRVFPMWKNCWAGITRRLWRRPTMSKCLPSKSGNLFRRDMSRLARTALAVLTRAKTCAVILKLTVITSLMPPSPLWWATKNWTPKPQKRRSKNIKSTRKPKTRWGCEAGVSVAFLIFCYRVIIPL